MALLYSRVESLPTRVAPTQPRSPCGGAHETFLQSISLNPEVFTISAQRCVSEAISSANSDKGDSAEPRESFAKPSLYVLDPRTSRIASCRHATTSGRDENTKAFHALQNKVTCYEDDWNVGKGQAA